MLKVFRENSIYLFLLFWVALPQLIFGQSTESENPTAYFTALIVSDIDSSIQWYQDVVGFEVINHNEVADIGLIQVNLSNGNSTLELIELSSSVSIDELVSDYNPRTRIIGLFKIGYQVPNFDNWLESQTSKYQPAINDVIVDPVSQKRMVILLDPNGNRVQFFEQ